MGSKFQVNNYIILLTLLSGSVNVSVSTFRRKQRTSRHFTLTGLNVLKSNLVGAGIQEMMADDMEEEIGRAAARQELLEAEAYL